MSQHQTNWKNTCNAKLRFTKYLLILLSFNSECVPPWDIVTTLHVRPEVRKDNSKENNSIADP